MENQSPHWTLAAYIAHNEAIRAAEAQFQGERDRRYAEVKNAEEKALRVKEQADRDALQLAREIQTYKDEKANELREQISRERGMYVTQSELKALADKIEATLAPVVRFISAEQGEQVGRTNQQRLFLMLPGLLIAVIAIIGAVVAVAYAIKR